jgi:hypothetical protein
MMRIMPRPQILQITITTRAMTARSQFCEQLAMALGARIRPIEIMMGPVTTGGKKRMTRFAPKTLKRRLTTT